MVRVRIDNISNHALLVSCFFLLVGIIMIARMIGNMHHQIASNMDMIIGIAGIIVVMVAMMYPLKRINAAARYFPKQKFMIYFRFMAITAFIFGITLFLNAWAWGSDHSKTSSYSGPAHYVEDQFSRARYAEEIRARTNTGLSPLEIIGLRALITTLSLGAFLLYFALLYQPYTTQGIKLDEEDIISSDEVSSSAAKALSGYAGMVTFMDSKPVKILGILVLIGFVYYQYSEIQEAKEKSNQRQAQAKQLREKINNRFQQYQIQPAPATKNIYVAARGIQGIKRGDDLHVHFDEILIEKHESKQAVNYEGLGVYIYTSQPAPNNTFSNPVDREITGILTSQDPLQSINDKTFIFTGKGSICIRYDCRVRLILGLRQAANSMHWINTNIVGFPTRVEAQDKTQAPTTDKPMPAIMEKANLKQMIENDLGINVEHIVKDRDLIRKAYCQGPARQNLWNCFLNAAKKAFSDRKPSRSKSYHEAAIAYAYKTGQPEDKTEGASNLLESLEAYAAFLLTQKEYQARVNVLQAAIATSGYLPDQGRLKTAQLYHLVSKTYFWSLDDMKNAEDNLSIGLDIFNRLPSKEQYQSASSHKLMAELKIKQENIKDALTHASLALEQHSKLKPVEPQPSMTSTSRPVNSNVNNYSKALREYDKLLQAYETEHTGYVNFLDSIKQRAQPAGAD